MKRISFFNCSLMLAVLVSGLVFTGCSETTREGLTPNRLSLFVGESATLSYVGDSKCRWSSAEPLIASVTQTGVVTGELVGKTTVKANNLSCDVTINPKYDTYYEPCMKWGCAQPTVQNHMYGYDEMDDSDYKSLSYKGKGKVLFYLYTFENGKLDISGLAISSSYASEIGSFLSERYIPVSIDEDDYTISFADYKKSTLVIVKVYSTSTLLIAYTKYPTSNSTRSIDVTEDLSKSLSHKAVNASGVDSASMDELLETIKSQFKQIKE